MWWMLAVGCPKHDDKGTDETGGPPCADDHTGVPCPTETGARSTTPSGAHTGELRPSGHTGRAGPTGGPPSGGHTGTPTDPPETGLALGDDRYRIPGNQRLVVPPPGVLGNDPGTPPFSVNGSDPVGSLGGTVVLAADGRLTFEPAEPPPAAFPYVDDFGYECADLDSFFDVFVEIEVVAPVHVVDNTAPGPGTGTAAEPFPTLAEAVAVAQPGDTIFVRRGDGTTAGLGPVDLPDGVDLAGSRIPCVACGDLGEGVDAGPVLACPLGLGADSAVRGLALECAGTDGLVAPPGVRAVVEEVEVLAGGSVALSAPVVDDLRVARVELLGALDVRGGNLTATDGVVIVGDVVLHDVTGAFSASVTGAVDLQDAPIVTDLVGAPLAGVIARGQVGGLTVRGALACGGVCVAATGVPNLALTVRPDGAGALADALVAVDGGDGLVVVDLGDLASDLVTAAPVVRIDTGAVQVSVLEGTVAGGPGADLVTLASPSGATVSLTNLSVSGFDRLVSGVLGGADGAGVAAEGVVASDLGGSAFELNTTGAAVLDLAVRTSTFRRLGGSGVNLGTQDDAVMRVLVEGSTFEDLGWDAIAAYNFGGGSSTLDTTLQLNLVTGSDSLPVPFNHAALFVNGLGGTTCADVRGNTISGTVAPALDLELRGAASASTLLFDPVRSGTVAAADLLAGNTATSAAVSGTGAVDFTNTSCATPP